MIYYFIDDFDNICRQKDSMDKDFAEVIDLVDLIDDINKLAEENKEIKIQYDNLKAQRDEFYRGARENANRVGQLEKENKELKLQLEAFKDKLCELGVSDVKLYGERYSTGLNEWLND